MNIPRSNLAFIQLKYAIAIIIRNLTVVFLFNIYHFLINIKLNKPRAGDATKPISFSVRELS